MKSLIVVVMFFSLSAACVHANEVDVISQAESRTLSWLALTDSGQYDTSWDQAATLFRNTISKDDWVRSLGAIRSPIGALKSRNVASADFSATLPGAPDGEYVVFQFNASFANKAAAVETVTAMKDEDGVWRVAGYFIR